MEHRNIGLPKLIPYEMWVPPEELSGELKVLNSDIMNLAFENIIKDFTPKHKVAFLSLCTATRPYYKSIKWKTFIECFGDKCDLIVTSNGGVIPRDYWECYPYLTYDAYDHEDDELYKNVLYDRLVKFFTKFDGYEKIIFNFRPNLRNREVAERFVNSELGKKFEIIITPSAEIYEADKRLGFPRGSMFPDLNPNCFRDILNCVGVSETSKESLW